MKTGTENRKKTILLGIFGAAALGGVLYNVFALFGGPSTPPPTIAPVTSTPAPVLRNGVAARTGTTGPGAGTGSGGPASGGGVGAGGAMAGVNAQKLASTSSSLDPTLDEAAMLRTESLVYAGSGRNIFSAAYTAAAPVLPTHVPAARPIPRPTTYVPQGPALPPPPPAIPLKFFGTAQRLHGVQQAFLLSGEDVYLASVGDIVARRFKVDRILPYGVQVTDLVNNNTQTLAMQQQ